MLNKKPLVMFFDIETTPLLVYVWRLGKQYVRQHQLAEQSSRYGIICISYAFNDGKSARTIDWGFKEQDSGKVIREFDKIVKMADVAIGKNSDKFDIKYINTQRVLNNLPPLPEWAKYTDDLEKQIRKHFAFPSASLDYISKQFGLGGKVKMEMQDWIDILECKNKKSFDKMCAYNRKDVEDTRALWNKFQPHIKPKLNLSAFYGDFRCANCGSQDLRKDGIRYQGKTCYQTFFCKGHGGYAGRVTIPSPEKNERMAL
jgi:uncharacterized protein YprB with RNaseH-like and TPR domain